jgi:EAL domain-containing protein (putative c-di-GMP-specific phosphodiesterase class I)
MPLANERTESGADLDGLSRRELELGTALGHAFSRDELNVVYQPLVGSAGGGSGGGQAVGVEALLRWDRTGHESVPPSLFIPIAERAGLMEGIGRWAVHTACAQLAAWNARGLGRDLILHVNLSAAELHDPKLIDAISRALADTGINPAQLCLEIPSAMLAEGGGRAAAVLHVLAGLGVQLCLSDFGKGASIDLLTRYEFDYAKMSRGLIGGLDSPLHRARLVRGLLGMTRALGTTLIAEYIERGDELDRVAALGILEVQGYATGRPVTGDELERQLADERSWNFATVG